MQPIWITWQDHRRSRELASALNITYQPLLSGTNGLFRYIILALKTIITIMTKKPDLIFCQNPSIILTFILCILKKISYKYKLVVDRHTNFKFGTENSLKPKWLIFHYLSSFTLRNADLTIVTNEPLAKIVSKKGGTPFVLQDKIPKLINNNYQPQLKGRINFLFICTYSNDEPIDNVLHAFTLLPFDYQVYVTGDYNKYNNYEKFTKYKNINFLGFLPENDYISYLFSCDATIVLTTSSMTLNCGSYESVAAGKLQIVAGSEEIMNYFSKGCEHLTSFDANSIIKSIKNIEIKLHEGATQELEALKNNMALDWQRRFIKLKNTLNMQ
jgi:glycosyltransferase involved in cell wall biosynthesis